jgi:acyl-CoA thioester hydrolase
MTPLIRHRIVVRFRDCDPLGHVNNAVYLTYLEQTRFVLWRQQLGYVARSAGDGGKRGVGFILARAEVDFVSQARYGDELEVSVGLSRVGRSSFAYEYTIIDVVTERVVARAASVQARFDYDAQQSVAIDDDLRAALAVPVGS